MHPRSGSASWRIFHSIMLTIRLSRVGRKNDPSFRVIVVESKRKPQPGNYLEMVGSYNPKSGSIDLKADRIKYWLSQGVTVSDTVHNMLVSKKIIDAKKINILPAFVAPAAEVVAVEAAASSVDAEASSEVQSSEVQEETPAVDTPVAENATEA